LVFEGGAGKGACGYLAFTIARREKEKRQHSHRFPCKATNHRFNFPRTPA
jgi:hypothetical protein